MAKFIQILKKTSEYATYGLEFIVAGLIIIIISHGFQHTPYITDLGSIFGIFGLFFLYWIFTWIHETGHAIAVKLCGYNLHVLRAYRFGFTFAPFKFRNFGPIKEYDFAGYVVGSPKRGKWSQKKDIIIFTAGSLASFIVGLLALMASFLIVDYSSLISLFTYLGFSNAAYDLVAHFMGPIGSILISCFLIGLIDPIRNWIPRNLGKTKNDGAQILSRLKTPYWNDFTWAENLINVEIEYGIKVCDKNLETIRQIYKSSPWKQTGDFKKALANIAWHRTEPHNFLKIINQNNTDFSKHSPQLYHKYMASLVLCNRADETIMKDFQTSEVQKENVTFLYWFASSLVHYKQKHYEASLRAIDKCRESLIKLHGNVGAEEQAIFDLIRSRKSLPVYT